MSFQVSAHPPTWLILPPSLLKLRLSIKQLLVGGNHVVYGVERQPLFPEDRRHPFPGKALHPRGPFLKLQGRRVSKATNERHHAHSLPCIPGVACTPRKRKSFVAFQSPLPLGGLVGSRVRALVEARIRDSTKDDESCSILLVRELGASSAWLAGYIGHLLCPES